MDGKVTVRTERRTVGRLGQLEGRLPVGRSPGEGSVEEGWKSKCRDTVVISDDHTRKLELYVSISVEPSRIFTVKSCTPNQTTCLGCI